MNFLIITLFVLVFVGVVIWLRCLVRDYFDMKDRVILHLEEYLANVNMKTNVSVRQANEYVAFYKATRPEIRTLEKRYNLKYHKALNEFTQK